MSKRGHAVVEFALMFPFFVFLCVAAFRLGLLAVQQFAWNRICAQTARSLALSTLVTAPELSAETKRLLSKHAPFDVQVQVQILPSRFLISPFRAQKRVELIDVLLEKDAPPFRMRARVREVRVRSMGRV